MQLEIGTSTRRYLPARGTAGLDRSLVSGNRRVPCPPTMITESTLLVLTLWRPVLAIKQSEVSGIPLRVFKPHAKKSASVIGPLGPFGPSLQLPALTGWNNLHRCSSC